MGIYRKMKSFSLLINFIAFCLFNSSNVRSKSSKGILKEESYLESCTRDLNKVRRICNEDTCKYTKNFYEAQKKIYSLRSTKLKYEKCKKNIALKMCAALHTSNKPDAIFDKNVTKNYNEALGNYEELNRGFHEMATNLISLSANQLAWYRKILNTGGYTYSFGDYLKDSLKKQTKDNELLSQDYFRRGKYKQRKHRRKSKPHSNLGKCRNKVGAQRIENSKIQNKEYGGLNKQEIYELMKRYNTAKLTLQKCEKERSIERPACNTKLKSMVSASKAQLNEYSQLFKEVQSLQGKNNTIIESIPFSFS